MASIDLPYNGTAASNDRPTPTTARITIRETGRSAGVYSYATKMMMIATTNA
jgi:hypothetical protein